MRGRSRVSSIFPVDPLSALPILADYFRQPEWENAAIVSPDVGRASLAGRYAQLLNLPLVVMHKRRTSVSVAETTHVVGEIAGIRPIIIDDIMAGGSVLKQIDALYEAGAEGTAAFAVTHPVLLPSALEHLETDDRIAKLVVSNTLPRSPGETIRQGGRPVDCADAGGHYHIASTRVEVFQRSLYSCRKAGPELALRPTHLKLAQRGDPGPSDPFGFPAGESPATHAGSSLLLGLRVPFTSGRPE